MDRSRADVVSDDVTRMDRTMLFRTGGTRSATVLLAALALTACTAPQTQTQTQSQTETVRDAPRHCPYVDHDVEGLESFGALTGVPVDCAVVFSDATPTWAEWERPWFLRHRGGQDSLTWASWAAQRPERHLVITQSLIPSEAPEDWRRRGAAGEYDAHVRAFARSLVESGLGDSTIRLAHEPNGTWFSHSVGDTAEERQAWAQYWARAVRVMREVEGTDLRFDLSINAGVEPIPIEEYYPGDDVVDIIGVDQYDSWTGTGVVPTGEERWRAVRDQPGGLAAIARFAQEHDKPLSIPETGLVSTEAHGAGDNPAFVRGLAEFVSRHEVVYVGYFDKNVKGTLRLEETPESLKVWREFAAEGQRGTQE